MKEKENSPIEITENEFMNIDVRLIKSGLMSVEEIIEYSNLVERVVYNIKGDFSMIRLLEMYDYISAMNNDVELKLIVSRGAAEHLLNNGDIQHLNGAQFEIVDKKVDMEYIIVKPLKCLTNTINIGKYHFYI